MLNVIMLSFVMLNVIMLSVVAPQCSSPPSRVHVTGTATSRIINSAQVFIVGWTWPMQEGEEAETPTTYVKCPWPFQNFCQKFWIWDSGSIFKSEGGGAKNQHPLYFLFQPGWANLPPLPLPTPRTCYKPFTAIIKSVMYFNTVSYFQYLIMTRPVCAIFPGKARSQPLQWSLHSGRLQTSLKY